MLLIGIILAFVILFAVMRWWSEGIYEASDAFLLVVVFGGLVVGLFAARTLWERLLAFVPLSVAAAYAFHSYKFGGMRAYLRQRCNEHMRAIQFDPRNLGAREFLATALHDLGELDRAIDEMQVAVNMGSGMESQYALSKWTKERYLRDCTNPVCKWCMTEAQQGQERCPKCGAMLPYQSPLARWLTGGKTAGARYYLIIALGLVLLTASLFLLPLKFAFIPLGLGVIAMVGWSLLASARN